MWVVTGRVRCLTEGGVSREQFQRTKAARKTGRLYGRCCGGNKLTRQPRLQPNRNVRYKAVNCHVASFCCLCAGDNGRADRWFQKSLRVMKASIRKERN